MNLPLDAPNDTPSESSVTIVPEIVDVFHDDRAYVPDEENDDIPAIVDRDVASDTLPAVDMLSASINVITNIIITSVQITAVRELITDTDDLNALKVIRDSLTDVLLFVDSKIT